MERRLRELFGPQGNGILENGNIRVAIDLQRDHNNVPIAVRIREIRLSPMIQGAMVRPPPLIREFWAEASQELVNNINARDLMQPNFYHPPNYYPNLDRMDEDEYDLPRHSPQRKVEKNYTVAQLKEMAKKKKISGYSKLRKQELMNLLGLGSLKQTQVVKKSDSSCPISNLKKYTIRKSPPRPSNDSGCRGKIFRGNDGLFYASVPNKNGVYRWVKVKK